MNIVILSRSDRIYSTQSLKEAALKRGHKVRVVDHTRCYTLIEKSKHPIYYQGEELGNADAIIPRIGLTVTQYGSAIVRQFEMRDVFTATSSLALVRARDKLRSLQILAREGIAVPKSAFSRQPSDIDDLIKQVGGPPLVIQSIGRNPGNGSDPG